MVNDATLFGLTRAQQAQEDRENADHAWPSMFVPQAFGVPRVLPPAPPRPSRTWEQVKADAQQIREDYLKMRQRAA